MLRQLLIELKEAEEACKSENIQKVVEEELNTEEYKKMIEETKEITRRSLEDFFKTLK